MYLVESVVLYMNLDCINHMCYEQVVRPTGPVTMGSTGAQMRRNLVAGEHRGLYDSQGTAASQSTDTQ